MAAVGDFIEVRVIGEAEGQAIINRFHYRLTSFATPNPDNILDVPTAFRAAWRDKILPLLTDNYRVLRYEALHIVDATLLVPPAGNGPVFRYGTAAVINGDAGVGGADRGQVDETISNGFPTYVAAGVRKVCGQTRETDDDAIVNRRLRGGCRIGPLPEADTDVGAPNNIDAALITALEDAFNTGGDDGLLIIGDDEGVDTTIAQMHVLGLYLGNNEPYPTEADPPAGRGDNFLYAPVTSVTINPYITSQVSRKQRFRLG